MGRNRLTSDFSIDGQNNSRINKGLSPSKNPNSKDTIKDSMGSKISGPNIMGSNIKES